MIVSLVSPGRNTGLTTTALLLGKMLGRKQRARVCVTKTGNIGKSILEYVGVNTEEDVTKTLTQMLSLIKTGSIEPEDLNDYCIKYSHNVDILNTVSNEINQKESDQLLDYILDNLTHDFIIVDVSSDIHEDTTQDILSKSDIICIVVTQNYAQLKVLEAWKSTDYFKVFNDVGFIYIVNRFDESVSNMKEMATILNAGKRRITKIDYNPFIIKCCNKGILSNILEHWMQGDYRVISTGNDLKKIVELLCRHLNIAIRR